jgi:hypothetical protein
MRAVPRAALRVNSCMDIARSPLKWVACLRAGSRLARTEHELFLFSILQRFRLRIVYAG